MSKVKFLSFWIGLSLFAASIVKADPPRQKILVSFPIPDSSQVIAIATPKQMNKMNMELSFVHLGESGFYFGDPNSGQLHHLTGSVVPGSSPPNYHFALNIGKQARLVTLLFNSTESTLTTDQGRVIHANQGLTQQLEEKLEEGSLNLNYRHNRTVEKVLFEVQSGIFYVLERYRHFPEDYPLAEGFEVSLGNASQPWKSLVVTDLLHQSGVGFSETLETALEASKVLTMKLTLSDGRNLFIPGSGDMHSLPKIVDSNGYETFLNVIEVTQKAAVSSLEASGYDISRLSAHDHGSCEFFLNQ